MAGDENKGLTQRRLLAAAREDNDEELDKILEEPDLEINGKDIFGNTALHYAALYGSTSVIESITCCEGCDIDPENKEEATPLHLAISSTFIEHEEARVAVVRELLDSGADTNKEDQDGSTALQILDRIIKKTASKKQDVSHLEEIKDMIIQEQIQDSALPDDVAHDDDDDGLVGSGSGSDSD
ncbi:ankyrin [Athelia psychrophila]|uniref:Ankyrin n=1 Tax=Athelia psychrophila TaxID=1759441 RepID=A0A166SD87_9AGAM|nr:ankyrin [Fibularhizoctonia sp. CBS 109695]